MAVWAHNGAGWQRTIGGVDPHNGAAFQAAQHNWVLVGGTWRDARAFEDQSMTMTIGTFVINTYTTTYPTTKVVDINAWGYDATSTYDYYGSSTGFGSLTGGADWFDTFAVDRDIVAFYWVEANRAFPSFLYLSVLGDLTSINNDDLFYSVIVDANHFTRSSANGPPTPPVFLNGATHWFWANVARPFPASGSVLLTMRGKEIGT